MKSIFRAAIICTLGLSGWAAELGGARPAAPNILLILADDLGYADLGVQGGTQFRTPRIDSIARSGIRFTNGYVSNSVCAPSRAGLLSGRIGIGFEANLPENSNHGLNLDLETMAGALRRGGYHTSCIGKWHLGELDRHYPTARGFDYFCGLRMGSRSYWYEPGGSDQPGDPKAIEINGKQVKFDGYLTDYFTGKAIEVIESHATRSPDAPFFIYLSYTAPHGPMHCKPGADRKFKDVIEDPKRRIYAAMVESLDEGVGRVLDTLERQGLRDNTLVVFLSDNGGPLHHNGSSNGPLQGAKGSLWEGGVRVPFMVQWPGTVDAGQVRDDLVSSLDLLPTFAAIAGVEPPEKMSGISLAEYLVDPKGGLGGREVFWRRAGKQNCALRSGRFKWLNRRETGTQFLFDLEEDIGEKNNIIAQQPEVAEKMRKAFANWEHGIPDPKFSSGWKKKKKTRTGRATGAETPKAKPSRESGPGAKASDPGEPPSIVLIYADDIGYGDLGCYGGTGAGTPQVDELASGGLRFLSAYSAAATCTPSRYSLLTGEYAFRNKDAEILPGNAPLIMDPARPSVASILREHGYATGLVGKWHLGLGSAGEPLDWNGLIKPGPREVGFDYSFHMAATADRVPSVYIENGRIVGLDPADPVQVSYQERVGKEPTGLSHPKQLRWEADRQHSGTIVNKISRIGFMSGGESARFRDEEMADTYVARAVEFIDRHQDDPFFLYFAPNENHVPRAVHERFQGASSLGPRGDALVAFDWCVGQLVGALQERGIDENTLVILSSDNGPVLFDGYRDEAIMKCGDHRAAGPWRGGKYSRREGGTRVPFIVSWPGRVQPGISEALVSQVDLLASLGALLGEPLPAGAGQDGINVLPTLLGEAETGRDHIIQEAWKEIAVRKGNWKYVPPGKITERGGFDEWKVTEVGEPGLLFHLAEDPGETRNLAADYPGKLDELARLIERVKSGAATEPARSVGAWRSPVQSITTASGRGSGEESSAGTMRFPYQIKKAKGLEVEFRDGRTIATGMGAFQLVLKPAGGEVWDMFAVSVLGLMLKNTGETEMVLDLMLQNDGATGWSNSVPGRTIVKAGEEMPLGVALYRTGDYGATDPAYLRMSGRPNGSFRHWHTFDPRKVMSLVITSAQKGPHSFELARMLALRKMDESMIGRFPFIDRFGQYIHRDWPGKIKSGDEIVASTAAEEKLAGSLGKPTAFSRYGGWKDGPRFAATGHFRTQKHEGKWWFIDPEGHLFWSYGVNCVGVDYSSQTPMERNPAVFQDLPAPDDPEFGPFFTKLEVEENYQAVYDVPHFDFTRANLYRKYGSAWAAKQVEQDIKRLKYCQFNTIGAWSDTAVAARKQVPYVVMLHYGYPSAGEKLPDPFDPKTRAGLRKGIRDYPVPFANDPWCLGAFVDNELHWKNDSRHLVAEILSHGTKATEAKKAFRDRLRGNYESIRALNEAWKTSFASWDDLLRTGDPSVFGAADPADCSVLAAWFADTFFKMVREELHAWSPNILYLGSRMNSASKDVIEAAARHFDVISANVYSYRPSPGNFGAVDKPVLISEFHFANISGNNLGSGLRSAQDAVQQGRLFRSFVREAVNHPRIIGAHWYQWRDQSVGGRYDGENYDVGLFDVADRPKAELIRAAGECGRTLYKSAK